MVSTIFEVISQTVSNFVATLVSAVNGLLPLIYDSTANSGAGAMTFVGTCLLIAVGIGIVYWCFRLLRGITSGLAR